MTDSISVKYCDPKTCERCNDQTSDTEKGPDQMIITAPEAIYPIDRANAIAAELRTGEDDDWTYAVEEIEANPGMARISITDEVGVFVANFG